MEFSRRELKTLRVLIAAMREGLKAGEPSTAEFNLEGYEEIELVSDALEYALNMHERERTGEVTSNG